MSKTSGGISASHESVLNARLAQILRELGLQATAENRQPGSRKQIDVDVEFDSHRVVLEAEIDNQKGALADASQRQQHADDGEVVADKIVAINYPAGLKAKNFSADTEIEWSVLPTEEFSSGSVWNLAGVLRRALPSGEDPDAIAKRLEAVLTSAVENLSLSQRTDLAANLGVDPSSASATIVRNAAKRALLVVASAAMFHARLDAYLSEMKPEIDARVGSKYQGEWPPEKLQHCISANDSVDALDTAWDMILAVDYRPIFESARAVLAAPAQDHAWVASVKRVAAQALSAARSVSSARHDLMGRIFHRLLDTARYDGSFYTSTSAAVLLAGLAIRPEDIPDDLSDYSIIDPACGTGTLLMAAAERIRDLRAHKNDQQGTAADAVTLIEDVITGLDVNTTACHMAATTLGLLSPSTAFSRMNVRRMPLGLDSSDDPKVGSLELLEHKKDSPRLDLGMEWTTAVHVDTGENEEIGPCSQDLVIMNPPYTRHSIRHDQFREDIEARLKIKERQLMAGRAGHGTSAGSMFIDLGEHLAKMEVNATLATVLPLSGANNPSGAAARKLLAEWFHIEWVVASHDTRRVCFSENTNISEMLVICRRHRSDKRARPDTRFVVLRRNSVESVDAMAVVASLEGGSLPEAIGNITTWPAPLMADGNWRPMGLTSAHLVEAFSKLIRSELFDTYCYSKAADIGPPGAAVRTSFTKHSTSDSHARKALWHNDTEITQTMRAVSDVYIHAKPTTSSQLAENYWSKRSRLLNCMKPRLNTARVNAVWLEDAALGSLWMPARVPQLIGDELMRFEKSLCAYLNSSLGWLSVIGCASSSHLSRLDVSTDAMRRLPVPKLIPDQAADIAEAFDELADTALQPLRYAATDKARIRLDDAVADALGVDREIVTTVRHELAAEPSVQKPGEGTSSEKPHQAPRQRRAENGRRTDGASHDDGWSDKQERLQHRRLSEQHHLDGDGQQSAAPL